MSILSTKETKGRVEPKIEETRSSVVEYAPAKHRQMALAEQAAQAAQQMHDLLEQLDRLSAEQNSLRAHCQVVEESFKIVQQERDTLALENARLNRENAAIHARIRAVWEIMRGIVQPVTEADATDHASTEALKAVEAALGPSAA